MSVFFLFVIRYLPSSDLEEIYTEYYGKKKITKEEIEVCSALMLLGWIGEKIAGEKLFPKYAKTSPFLVEDFHTYFQGMVAHHLIAVRQSACLNDPWSYVSLKDRDQTKSDPLVLQLGGWS